MKHQDLEFNEQSTSYVVIASTCVNFICHPKGKKCLVPVMLRMEAEFYTLNRLTMVELEYFNYRGTLDRSTYMSVEVVPFPMMSKGLILEHS